jgi:hypothetical protein
MNDLEDRVTRALRAEAEDGDLTPRAGSWDSVVAAARRRRLARAGVAVAVAAAATISVVHVLSLGRGDSSRVHVGPSTAEPEGDGPSSPTLLPFPEECESSDGGLPPPTSIPAEDVDDLRFIPTWLPEGDSIQHTYAEQTSRCPRSDDVEPVLVLQATGDDETIDGVIRVYGPFTSRTSHPPDHDPNDGGSYTQLRETTAHIEVVDGDTREQRVTWTEPDDVTWVLTVAGADGDALRDVAEALELDGTPEQGGAFASLPPDEIPSGFAITWQATELPPVPTWSTRSWVIASYRCQVRFEEKAGNAPLPATGGEPGDVEVRRLGVPVGWSDADTVRWDVGSDVTGVAECDMPSDVIWNTTTAAQLIESVERVEVDDSRLRPPAG